MKQFLRFLSLFLLFGLPFVVFPLGVSYYEVPKVILAQICIEFIVVLRLLSLQNAKKFFSFSRMYPYAILIGLTIIDLFFMQTKLMFFGNQFRMQGIFLLWHLLLFSLFAPKIFLEKISIRLVFGFLIMHAAGAVFLQTTTAGRAVGFLGEPNALAVISVFTLPLLLFAEKKKSILWVLSLLLAFVIVFLSGSRSGLIALLFEIVAYVLFLKVKMQTKYVIAICVVLFCAALVTPFFGSDLHESRLEIWHASFNAFIKHPLIGGGFGNVDLLIHEGTKTYASFISARYVDSAHNIFLDFLLQGGILGIFAFCCLLFSGVTYFVREKQYLLLIMLFGLIVVLSFNPQSVWTLVVFWYLLGQKNQT